MVEMKIFCLVSLRISSLSMPPLPLEDLSDSAILSAVSEIWLEDWGGMRNRLKFEGGPRYALTAGHIYLELLDI